MTDAFPKRLTCEFCGDEVAMFDSRSLSDGLAGVPQPNLGASLIRGPVTLAISCQKRACLDKLVAVARR